MKCNLNGVREHLAKDERRALSFINKRDVVAKTTYDTVKQNCFHSHVNGLFVKFDLQIRWADVHLCEFNEEEQKLSESELYDLWLCYLEHKGLVDVSRGKSLLFKDIAGRIKRHQRDILDKEEYERSKRSNA